MAKQSNSPTGLCTIESVKTTKGKTILQPMALEFPSGCVTAILGPSGSGKTTLLGCLTNSIQSNVVAQAELSLPGLKALVPQEDRLHGFFTVESYLRHYAGLAGLRDDSDLDTRIDTLIAQLGLKDQSGTIVGDIFLKGLSGGQKRRLSIALEAVTEPQSLFLDEPTSGLDSESALQVMEFLKNYVKGGTDRRVILTIHQPSSFIWQTIDHCILLSKAELMYNGRRDEMETYFADAGYPTPTGWNPADHYVTLVNDEFRDHELSVKEWANMFHSYKKPDRTQEEVLQLVDVNESRSPESARRTNSPLVALQLTKRYFMNLAFNPGILGTRIAMYTMLALMVGALFWELGDRTDLESIQSRTAVSFYCVAFFIFMSVAVLPFTVMERDIVDKEVLNQYYNPMYYQVAQGLSSIPGCAILAGLVTVIIILMTKLNEPYWYFLNMFLSLMVAEALAQLISHLVPHFVIGMALLAGLYGFFMLIQGFMLVPSQFPDWLRWLNPVAFHTYSWRSFMDFEFRGEVFTDPTFPTGEAVLQFYEIDDVDRVFDMIVLAGYCGVVHTISLLVLLCRYNFFTGQIKPLSKGFDDKCSDDFVSDGGSTKAHRLSLKGLSQSLRSYAA